MRAVAGAARRLPRLVDAGLVEVGDEVQSRRPPPTVAYARATGDVGRCAARSARPRSGCSPASWRRRRRRASSWRRCRSRSARTLRALVAGGPGAHRAPGGRRVAPEARAAVVPPGITLTPAQAHAVDALVAGAGGRVRQLPAAGDHRLRQDRGLPARHRRGAGGGARRAGAGAGDRADAAARRALSGPLRRGRRGAAQRAAAARAAGGLAAAAGGRGRHRARARGRRCSRRCARSAWWSSTRSTTRRSSRRRACATTARDLAVVRAQRAGAHRDPRLGDAVAGEHAQRRRAGASRACSLPERATPRPLPEVTVVDLRRHPPGPDGLLSAPLAEALGAALAAGEQSILFLNRRGFSTLAAVPRLRPRRPLPELRGVDDLPPRALAPGLSLLRAPAARARALPVVRVDATRAHGHRHRARRGDRARALPRRARGAPGSRHRRRPQRRRAAASTRSWRACTRARSTSWSGRRW